MKLDFAVPAASRAVDLDRLEWTLGCAVGRQLDALNSNAPTARGLEERLQSMHIHGRGMSAPASEVRLRQLRLEGDAPDAVTREREYAALFEPLRDARRQIAVQTHGESTAGASAPAGTGRSASIQDVTAIVPVDAGALVEGLELCATAHAASAELGRALLTALRGSGLPRPPGCSTTAGAADGGRRRNDAREGNTVRTRVCGGV